MHPRFQERLTSSNALCSADIPIFWRDLCLACKRTLNKKVHADQVPKAVVTMWTSLSEASLYSSSFSSPPWIELALPYIFKLQDATQHTLNPGCMAVSVTSAYLTCFTTNHPHSSHFTTLPGRLLPLVAWLGKPEQIAWVESIHLLLLRHFDELYLQAGLIIAAWGCHQLQEGQSRLCCCSVPADHADYTSGRDLSEYDRAGEHAVTGFLSHFISALLLHHVCMPSKKLMVLQADIDSEEEEAVAEAAAKAALAAEVVAGTEARDTEGHSGSGCSTQGEAAAVELLGTSAGEMGPADVQVRGVCRARRGPISAGMELAGAAPAAGGSLLATEGVGERGGNPARIGEARGTSGGEGGAAAGGRGGGASGGTAGVVAAGRRVGEAVAAAGGLGGGGRAAAAGSELTGTEAASEGTGGISTTPATAGCGAGGGGVVAAVAGVMGPGPAAKAHSASSAAGSNQHEAVGEFSAGVLWLGSADHTEVLGGTLAEYHAEDPVGYENVHYMVLKVLVELLLLQTGVTGGPSLDTAAQVIS